MGDRSEMRKHLDAAMAEVSAICKGRMREGGKDWRMCIPAQQTDSDLVICAALRDLEALLSGEESAPPGPPNHYARQFPTRCGHQGLTDCWLPWGHEGNHAGE